MSNLFNHSKYLQDKLTVMTPVEVIEAFRAGYKKFINDEASKETLAIFIAQSCMESGWWKSMHNYNFGNIRCNINKLGDGEYFTMYKCGEIINGKEYIYYPPDPNSVFQAFLTAEEGVRHHLKFLSMKTNYTEAWGKAIHKDPEGYIVALKKGGYFTASLDRYRKTFMPLYNKFLEQIEDKEGLSEEMKNKILIAQMEACELIQLCP